MASTVTCLLSAAAMVVGVLVLGERITLLIFAGIVLCLAEVALARTPVRARYQRWGGDRRRPWRLVWLAPTVSVAW